ncbi:MAG: DUF61 family protein [Methanobacteriaceae archaeon]|nr:DUF61 family protein [Methanobacteriaceae archaeon]
MCPKRDKSDIMLKKQIFNLNRHIPLERRNLEDLLRDERPHVLGVDGNRHRFKRSELERISKIIKPEEYYKIKLPIYIEIESNISGARILGNLEIDIVNSILKKDNQGDEVFIYRPEIRILRKELPTTTQYMFLVK